MGHNVYQIHTGSDLKNICLQKVLFVHLYHFSKNNCQSFFIFKVGVNPEIMENKQCGNFQTITVMFIKVYIFWNVNESENLFLISNFTKNVNFVTKWQKITFLVKKISWTDYVSQFWVKNAKIC